MRRKIFPVLGMIHSDDHFVIAEFAPSANQKHELNRVFPVKFIGAVIGIDFHFIVQQFKRADRFTSLYIRINFIMTVISSGNGEFDLFRLCQ